MRQAGVQRFDWDELQSWGRTIFQGVGVGREHADQAAGVLVRTDARGYATHGLSRIPSYIEKIEIGDVNVCPAIQENFEEGFGSVEADRALGQIAGPLTLETAIDRTARKPHAVYLLRNSGHLGALGTIVEPAAAAGRIALLVQATPPSIGLPGASAAMLGNNPIAVAAPRADGPPIVIDMSCSVVARGKVLAAAKLNRPLDDGWALGTDGLTTTDANQALMGMLLPFGGYKGMLISMIVEILAGSLSGRKYNDELNPAGKVGSATSGLNAFILVINPDLVAGREAYDAYVSDWTRCYMANGAPGTRLPGTRSRRAEKEARSSGVPLHRSIASALSAFGLERRVPFPRSAAGGIHIDTETSTR